MTRHMLPLLVMWMAVACQSTKGKTIPEPREPLKEEDIDTTSKDLWSPEQRKANANYYFMLAQDRLLHKDREAALKLFDASYNLDPNPFVASKLISLKAMIVPEEAFPLARKMVLLYPKDPDVNVLYGQLQLARKAYKTAAKQFTRVLVLDDQRIEAYMGLIQVHRATGRPETAITVAREMLKKDPSFSDGWALLAKLYLTKNVTS